MKTRAAILLEGGRKLELSEVAVAPPCADEVLARAWSRAASATPTATS